MVSVNGAIALLATVFWAIPRHDDLDRMGQSSTTIGSLLQANALRTAALSIAAVTLVWSVGQRLSRSERL